MSIITFFLLFPTYYVNICSLSHETAWQHFEHMPNQLDEEKSIWPVCIKLWGLYQAKVGLATIIMNDKVESAFPRPSQMSENLLSLLYVEAS